MFCKLDIVSDKFIILIFLLDSYMGNNLEKHAWSSHIFFINDRITLESLIFRKNNFHIKLYFKITSHSKNIFVKFYGQSFDIIMPENSQKLKKKHFGKMSKCTCKVLSYSVCVLRKT